MLKGFIWLKQGLVTMFCEQSNERNFGGFCIMRLIRYEYLPEYFLRF